MTDENHEHGADDGGLDVAALLLRQHKQATKALDFATARAGVALACVRWEPVSPALVREVAEAERMMGLARAALEECLATHQRVAEAVAQKQRDDARGKMQ